LFKIQGQDCLTRNGFRISEEAFNYIYDLVREDIDPIAMTNHTVSGREKLMLTIRYLATGDYQTGIGMQFGKSRACMSRTIKKVVNAIVARGYRLHVRWPANEQRMLEVWLQLSHHCHVLCFRYNSNSTQCMACQR
jgi:hypothetical protein